MPETHSPDAHAHFRLRCQLGLFMYDVRGLDSPLVLSVEDAGIGLRADLRVEPIDRQRPASAGVAGLPTPLPYSPSEAAIMLAIGQNGAKLAKEFVRVTGFKADDPRFKQIVRGLRDRQVLGHCGQGYFWTATNPDLEDDDDSAAG